MASYNELNALIDAYINRNGVQAITGQILNGVLKAMVEQLGRGYTIMGAATPTTDPGTPDGPECYFASETGIYTDFGGLQVVPGELALLCYTPTDGWTKATIYEGFREVGATIDGNVGTPSVGVSYADGVLSFDFHNMKGNPGQNGQDGAAAGFGTIGADITGGVGTPAVSVESSGPATAKNLQFHFTNLKGETGVTSVVATVDNTTGTPACTVSLVGQQLTLAFSGLKGAQGDTGSSVDYPYELVNNCTTDDATKGLAASQGVALQAEVSQLEAKVDYKKVGFGEGTKGKYINLSGVEASGWNPGYISDYIAVKAGQIVKSYCVADTDALVIAFYDMDKVFTATGKVAGTDPYTMKFYTSTAPVDGFVRCYTDKYRVATAWDDSYILLNSDIVHQEDLEEIPVIKEKVEDLENCFFKKVNYSDNMLDLSECNTGFINSSGIIYTGGSYDNYIYSGYILVSPGSTLSVQYGGLTIEQGRSIRSIWRCCFYDVEKNVVAGGLDSSSESVTIPLGVSYIRLCLNVSLSDAETQNTSVVLGTEINDFSAYAENTYILVLNEESNNRLYIEEIVEEKISDKKFGPENFETSLGKNAFDKDALVQGTNYWVNTFSWNGSDSANNAYFTAIFPVKPNQQYVFWQGENRVGVRSVNEYDAVGNFISGTSVGNAYVVKTGANTAFLKCSFVTGSESVVKVEPIVQNGATIRAFIPSSLYCAVGRTIEIYNTQVCITKGINVQWRIDNSTTNAIRPLKRKLQVVGNATGEAVAVFVAYDDNKNVLFAGTTRIYFVSATLSTTKSIVPVGDSLTNSKVWLAEVERLSGNNIGYVGEYSWGLEDADGNMQTGGHEGRSGFSAKDYATGAVYTYGGESTPNKWWNGTRFSLTAFENATSITPDIVQLWVGVNGLSDDNAENANYIKTLVDNIRLDNATIPIFVCVTPFKGDQNAIGLQGSVDGFVAGVSAWKYNEDFKIMDLMKRIYTIFSSGYTNVHIIDIAIAMDSEYNYGWQEVAVNPRAVQTEHIQTDSVHPQAQGYFQIADILYSNYCAVLNA